MTNPLILALDVTGYPFAWLTWQEAVTHLVAERVDRQLGEFEFTFSGGRCKETGEISKVTISSIMAMKGRNPYAWHASPPMLSNEALFQRDRYMCAYCGREGKHHHLTRDHIHPLSRGGEDSWTNCVTACFTCNNRKGDKRPEEAGLVLLYVPYVPSAQEGLILANRRILADQMDMLASLLPAHSRLLAA